MASSRWTSSTVAFHLTAPNGNFPYLTSSDNYNMIIIPNNYDPAKWQSSFLGTGPFVMKSYTPKVGAIVHPQRAVLGPQGPARRDRVHLLRHPDAPDPRPHRRDHRRRRAVRRRGRRAVARPWSPVQRHQPQVERAPAAFDAQRPGAVHRPAGAPGDRAHARPAGHRGGAVQGQRRHRQRQPVRPGLPVDEHTAWPSARRTSPWRSRCCPQPGTRPGSRRTWSPSSSWRSRSTPRSWCRRRSRSG